MTTAPPPNPRASLLAGLRTGGVRSASTTTPNTAAPGGSFVVPRFASQSISDVFPSEPEDTPSDLPSRTSLHGLDRSVPMTAAVDGQSSRFSQQQQGPLGMNPHSAPFSPSFSPSMLAQQNNVQSQALQMQMMQLEILRLQNLQAQQFQAEILAQTQRLQQSQPLNRRVNLGLNTPASAGPLTSSFDLRSATLSAQLRRANQAEHVRSKLGLASEDQGPMTGVLGGKFGSRNTTVSRSDDHDDFSLPPTPNSTTVISGGTPLGTPSSSPMASTTPSKSDSATSWRRGGNNNSVLSGINRIVTSPSVKVTPPPGEGEHQPTSLPPLLSPLKTRPQPLCFSPVISQPLPSVAIDTSPEGADATDNDDAYSTGSGSSKSTSNSSPTTPRSSSSNEMPLSPREEASKKLYEGLGIGRPTPAQQQQQLQSVVSHRVASQPMRQPRGPPSGADELGPKNFATRIRRKAIGGLGMLMDARERREFIEVY